MPPGTPGPSRTRSRRYPRPQPPRRRALWLWLVVALVVAAAASCPLLLWRWRSRVPLRVGIVAGHLQSDSGATCPDGLREVDLTAPIARAVVERLQEEGYQAEVLPEYSARLRGYRGLALVSLHVDSCIAGLSGFKIAGRSLGPAAGPSKQLVDCLTRAYAANTGLPYHRNTITPAMTDYHAFRQVGLDTPAAIVELGFLGGDRDLLTAHQERVSRAVAEGILDYLKARRGKPTPTPQAAAPAGIGRGLASRRYEPGLEAGGL